MSAPADSNEASASTGTAENPLVREPGVYVTHHVGASTEQVDDPAAELDQHPGLQAAGGLIDADDGRDAIFAGDLSKWLACLKFG